MGLLCNNITPRLVNTEMGSPYGATPTDLTVREVACIAGQNPFSFYGQWHVGTDASKNACLTYGASNYRLGDFRCYNHTASTPKGANDFTHNWGPSVSCTELTQPAFTEQMNIQDIRSSSTSYIRYVYYLSTANRTAETSPIYSSNENITYAVAPLYGCGHIRNVCCTQNSIQTPCLTCIPTAGLSTPNDYIYSDTFISDTGSVRQINLGTSVSGGYTTITTHQQQQPCVIATGNIVPPPASYTAAFGEVSTVSTPVGCYCTSIQQTWNGTTFAFYVHIKGICGGSTRILGASSATIYLKHDAGNQCIYSGCMCHSSNTYVSGTLCGLNSWSYDEIGCVQVCSVTFNGCYTVV